MNNKIEIFNHEQFGKIRTVYNKEKDEIWFVARDLSKQLGYKSIERMYDHVDIEDKVEINPQDKLYQGSCENGSTMLEPNKNIFRMILINESGLYNAVFGSNLPQAKQFKRWVTSEVLPSIRKSGGYIANQENLSSEEILANAVLVAQNVIKQKELELEREKLLRKEVEHTVKLQEPKVEYFDKVLSTKGSMTATQVAKMFGLRSAIQLNNMLHELKIQYKQSGQWLLYSKYSGKGYTESATHIYTDSNGYEVASKATKWTEKGIHFIYNALREHDLIKEIKEQEV